MDWARVAKAVVSVAASLTALLWFFVSQPILPVTRRAGPGADPERLKAHVRALSVELLPRDAGHPANLDRAAAYIRDRLKEAGGKVSEQPYTFKEFDQHNKLVEYGPYRNVIASFGPDTPERLVIGAHYDAYGELPGADDNASGAAGLLELARLLGRAPPPLRTDLVAFSCEEPPNFATENMGSAVYAAALSKAGAKVRMMLAVEMIGYFTDAPKSQGYPLPLLKLFYPSKGDFIVVVGKGDVNRRVKRAMRETAALPVLSIAAPVSLPGVDWSDHRSFWARGYPAAMVTDTAFYRNHEYHKAGDTLDRLDYARMARVVDGLWGVVESLARD